MAGEGAEPGREEGAAAAAEELRGQVGGVASREGGAGIWRTGFKEGGESLAGAEGRDPCVEMRLPGRGTRGGAGTGDRTSGKGGRARAVWGRKLNRG